MTTLRQALHWWRIHRPDIADTLRFVGGFWGDQREYLSCPFHGGEIPWTTDADAPHVCPQCGEALHVHLPHGEQLEIRYLVWRGRQKWIPQRMYVYPGRGEGEKPYRYVQFWNRELLKRDRPDWDWIDRAASGE